MKDRETFLSPTKGPMDMDGIAHDVTAFIEEEPECSYKLIVGTDSAVKEETEFVSVIVMHRIGKRARYFWTRHREPAMASLRQRIWREASLSLDVAERLTGKLGERLEGFIANGTCQLEVHVDIGQHGPTRDMIKEVVGMVLGSGFMVKIKPESYAASSVADKHV